MLDRYRHLKTFSFAAGTFFANPAETLGEKVQKGYKMKKRFIIAIITVVASACSKPSSRESSPGLVAPAPHSSADCPALEGIYQLKNSERVVFATVKRNEAGNLTIQFDTSDWLTVDGTKQKNGDGHAIAVCHKNSVLVAFDLYKDVGSIRPTSDGFIATFGNQPAEYMLRDSRSSIGKDSAMTLTEIGLRLKLTITSAGRRSSWASTFVFANGLFLGVGANQPTDGPSCLIASWSNRNTSGNELLEAGTYRAKVVSKSDSRIWFSEPQEIGPAPKYLVCTERKANVDVRELTLDEARATLGSEIQLLVEEL